MGCEKDEDKKDCDTTFHYTKLLKIWEAHLSIFMIIVIYRINRKR